MSWCSASALRSFHHRLLHRLGSIGILVTSFLAGWLLGDSITLGIVFAASWFLFPWLEILTRVRRLRLPIERTLEPQSPPPRSAFPLFEELSDEIEAQNFVHVADTGWDWQEHRQFYRVFYQKNRRTQAAICLIEQSGFAFYYVSLRSRDAGGKVYMTWNYPFSYGLKLSPQCRLNPAAEEANFPGLEKRHLDFLAAEKVDVDSLVDQNEQEIQEDIQSDMRSQIVHNLDLGLLKRDGENHFRYSLRGMIFLWFQVLRDMVRLS